jgi:hypothetical protein
MEKDIKIMMLDQEIYLTSYQDFSSLINSYINRTMDTDSPTDINRTMDTNGPTDIDQQVLVEIAGDIIGHQLVILVVWVEEDKSEHQITNIIESMIRI